MIAQATSAPPQPTTDGEPTSEAIAILNVQATDAAVQVINLASTQVAIQTQISVPTDAPEFNPEAAATVAAVATSAAEQADAIVATQQALSTQMAASGATQAPTSEIVGTLQVQATEAANQFNAVVATQQAIQTQISLPTDAPGFDPNAAAVATSAAEQISAFIATQQVLATQIAGINQISGVLPEIVGTQIALATQAARQDEVQQAVATQQGMATQAALATRAALVEQALSGTLIALQQTPTTPPLSGINLTATAIAGAFQLLTQQAPEATTEAGVQPTVGFPTLVPTPSTLPQTGLFDEVSSGANLGVLALMVLGLVGVVIGARYLRSRNTTADAEAEPVAKRQQPPTVERHELPDDEDDLTGEE